MKKLLTAALVVGLLAVPSAAMARNGADDTTNSNVPADARSSSSRLDSSSSRSSSGSSSDSSDDNSTDDNSADHNNRSADDANESRVTIPGQTGTIKVQNEATVPADGISLDDAVAAAQAKMPGKTIEKVETETEDDEVVYSVRFTDDSRVDVRASDGVVVRTEIKDRDDIDDDLDDRDDEDNSGSGNSGSGNSDDD